ncbi:hypothetical protein C479_14218 [Halovivax asiaticus JCM 14624]|uniref:Uncharacterized protein n=1 Tax=Halovivax asiaticus JCM 14624 TaxID=1227490 RepID=M0BC84_9EURY|nr:hypothetical protein [Halovivax asiaticus]ELZ08501.1 hypothetical protein C479_14218 [Halovivax asiaticus JCM 14624]
MIESLLGIDWRRTGPRELVREQRERIQALETWQKVALAVAIAFVGFYVQPSPPAWAWLVALSGAVGIAAAIMPAKRVIGELVSDDFELLEELKPVSGDRATRKISRDRWAELTVVDHDGKIRDKSYLTEVSRLVDVNESGQAEWQQAYEVDRYFPERNVAIASWLAGASNADLRRYRRAYRKITSELSKEADQSLEEIVDAPEARRRAASVTVNAIIQAAEGVEAPGEHSMADELEDLRQEAEESVDKLLEDRGMDDIEKALAEDIDEEADEPATPESVEISIDGTGANGGDDE